LKFIGEQKPESLAAITEHLQQVQNAPIEIRLPGTVFSQPPKRRACSGLAFKLARPLPNSQQN